MKKILVPLADGFEEIETVTIVDVLRRADLEVVTAGIKPGELIGSRRIKLVPDTLLDLVMDDHFDLVVLPGGQPGVDNLRKDERVLKLLRERHEKKELIGAICAAPLILRDAGLTEGLKMTSYPALAGEFSDSLYEQASVVSERHFITSRGPGTAMEFSLKLIEVLAGPEKAAEVAGKLLVPRNKA